jgi:Holliday junction DNA helicase RuvA
MIGQLRGKLLEKQLPFLLIDVQGVGYLVQSPLSTLFKLPEIGEEITLHTHLIIREDAHALYGFITRAECQLFQEIIKVNGIGPKVALAILSNLSVEEFISILQAQEINRLQKIPGIGIKTAQRLLVELQGKKSFFVPMAFNKKVMDIKAIQEATDALIALGYKANEATKAIAKVQNVNQGCEYIIKEALQGMAKL